MNRKTNIFYNIICIVVPIALLIVILFLCKNNYEYNILPIMLYCVVGALFFGVLNVVLHEVGHVFFGKLNGFVLINFTVLIFSFTKTNRGTICKIIKPSDCAGSTELVSKNTVNFKRRFAMMTAGGIVFNALLVIAGIVPLFLIEFLPEWIFVCWSICLPISTYCFFNNALPIFNSVARNDGGVLYGLKKNDCESQVGVNLMKIESELYNGITPSEIESNLYFELPQLPENSLSYISLLSARFFYYLNERDYEGAKKVCSRFISLYDYLPEFITYRVKTYLLYSYCTFDFNEKKADDLTSDLEKFLNDNNDAFTVLVKTAYVTFVQKDIESFEKFYAKGIREADKMKITGLGILYKELFNRIKNKLNDN